MENFSDADNFATAPRNEAGSIISHAFEKYTGSIGYVLLASLICMVISLAIGPISGFDSAGFMEEVKYAHGKYSDFMSFPGLGLFYGFSGLSFLLISPLYVGLIYIFNKKNHHQKIDVADLFIGYRQNFVNILIYTLIAHIIIAFSAMLCLFPLLFVFPFLMLGYPILLFENARFSDAFSKSFNIAKENYGTLLGASFLGLLISVSGIVLCFIGIILTMYFYLSVSYSAYCALCGTPKQIEYKD